MNKKKAMASKRLNTCEHLLVRKAYYLGLPGDGYVCVACGESGSTPDWPIHTRKKTITLH